jgi:hypothetical protein
LRRWLTSLSLSRDSSSERDGDSTAGLDEKQELRRSLTSLSLSRDSSSERGDDSTAGLDEKQ